MSIIFENGMIKISEKAIENIAKKKNLNLKCKIEEEGIKIDLEKEFFVFDLPIRIFIPEIEIIEKILIVKKLKINLSSMPIPLISIIPFIKKYPYITIDNENNLLLINLKDLTPDNISYEIEKIIFKNGEILAEIKNITIIL